MDKEKIYKAGYYTGTQVVPSKATLLELIDAQSKENHDYEKILLEHFAGMEVDWPVDICFSESDEECIPARQIYTMGLSNGRLHPQKS